MCFFFGAGQDNLIQFVHLIIPLCMEQTTMAVGQLRQQHLASLPWSSCVVKVCRLLLVPFWFLAFSELTLGVLSCHLTFSHSNIMLMSRQSKCRCPKTQMTTAHPKTVHAVPVFVSDIRTRTWSWNLLRLKLPGREKFDD